MAYENKKRSFIDNFSKDKLKRVALSVLALSIASPMAFNHFENANNKNVMNVVPRHAENTSDKLIVKSAGILDKTHKDGAVVLMKNNITGVIKASDDKKYYEFIFNGDARKNQTAFNEMLSYASQKASNDGVTLSSNIQDNNLTKTIDIGNITGVNGQIVVIPRKTFEDMKAKGIDSINEVSHETVKERGVDYKTTSEKVDELKRLYKNETKLSIINMDNELGINSSDIKPINDKEDINELKKETENLDKILLENIEISSM